MLRCKLKHVRKRGSCSHHTRMRSLPLQWRHNGCDSVSNHQPHDCLLNRLFRRSSKKTSKPRVTGLCAGHRGISRTNGQLRGICFHWWRHHAEKQDLPLPHRNETSHCRSHSPARRPAEKCNLSLFYLHGKTPVTLEWMELPRLRVRSGFGIISKSETWIPQGNAKDYYVDVTMSIRASQITGNSSGFVTVCFG